MSRDLSPFEYAEYRLLKFTAVLGLNEQLMRRHFEDRHRTPRFRRASHRRRRMIRKIAAVAVEYSDLRNDKPTDPSART